MSDFLISELLILSLLIAPLVRPFVKFLKPADAVSVFPFIALAICFFTIWGQGFSVSFLPVFILVIVCSIAEFQRFVKLCSQLPNGFYSSIAMPIHTALLACTGCMFIFCLYFAPEPDYKFALLDIKQREFEPISEFAGKGFGCIFEKESKNSAKQEDKKEKPPVIILKNSVHAQFGTVSRYFFDTGFKVLEVNPYFSKPGTFSIPDIDTFHFVLNKIIADNNGVSGQLKLNKKFSMSFSKIIEHNTEKSSAFAFAEGLSTGILIEYILNNPGKLAGAFIVISEDDPLPDFPSSTWAFVADGRDGLTLSEKDAEYPICVYIEKREQLTGHSSLRQNDIAAAVLMGSSRDKGLKDKLSTARAFERWISLKSRF